MSTARQVVDVFGVNPVTLTPDAERAAVVRPSLLPRIPLQWWWGNASSALVSGARKASATPAPGAPAPGTRPSGSGGCCG